MKYLVLLVLVLVTIQNKVILNRRVSCSGRIIQGEIFNSEKCVFVNPQQKLHAAVRHKGSSFTLHLGCQRLCYNCTTHLETKYGCNGNTESYYGNPAPLKETGFYFNIYADKQSCERNVESFSTFYFVEAQCIDQGVATQFKMSSKSQKIGYNKQRNVILIEEFEDVGCKGNSRRQTFPLNYCSQLPNGQPGIYYKAMRTLQ